MSKKTYSINSLTENELKLILEALLFSSCVDVNAEWYKEDSLTLFDIANKIRSYFPDVVTEDVYIYEDDKKEYNDEHAVEVLKTFPEIKKTNKNL